MTKYKGGTIQTRAVPPVKGSVADVASLEGKTLAEAFMTVDMVAIVDISGSMNSDGSEPGVTRHTLAAQALSRLQNENPGKVALVVFSESAEYCPDGKLPSVRGSTCVGTALRFCKIADLPGMRLLLISDGEPTDGNEGLAVAKTYGQRIDTIYVGPPHGGGNDFLRKLSAATGGTHVEDFAVMKLLETSSRLLKG